MRAADFCSAISEHIATTANPRMPTSMASVVSLASSGSDEPSEASTCRRRSSNAATVAGWSLTTTTSWTTESSSSASTMSSPAATGVASRESASLRFTAPPVSSIPDCDTRLV